MSCSGSTHGRAGFDAFNLRRFPAAGFESMSLYSTATSRICERWRSV
jgi:hypothetical protein